MNAPSNLPPGVTDAMIEDQLRCWCEECGEELQTEDECEAGICEECDPNCFDAHADDRHNDPRRGQAAWINYRGER